MGPGDLKQALSWIPAHAAEKVLVGFDTADDAAVYRLEDGTLLLQSVDFFPPIVDSPYTYGQIAAANALSDIYAMGGKPLTALNLAAFPCSLGLDLLGEILKGGLDKVEEAGALIVGGHTIQDAEPKYGLSVIGTVSEAELVTNSNARPGDVLILTKPLGMGILATALKGGLIGEDDMRETIDAAVTLNRDACEAMLEVGVNACTDITGFGLIGHLQEMLVASGVSAVIEESKIPVYEGAISFAEEGIVPGGARDNQQAMESVVELVPNSLPLELLYDPQTSGGLLISLPEKRSTALLAALEKRAVATRAVIGRVEEARTRPAAAGRGPARIRLV